MKELFWADKWAEFTVITKSTLLWWSRDTDGASSERPTGANRAIVHAGPHPKLSQRLHSLHIFYHRDSVYGGAGTFKITREKLCEICGLINSLIGENTGKNCEANTHP